MQTNTFSTVGIKQGSQRASSWELQEVWVTLTSFKGKDKNKLILWNPGKLLLQITARVTEVSAWQKATFTPSFITAVTCLWALFVCVYLCVHCFKWAWDGICHCLLPWQSILPHQAVCRLEGLPWATLQWRTRVNSQAQTGKARRKLLMCPTCRNLQSSVLEVLYIF